MRCKCGFLFITFLYLEAVKSSNNIKFSIDLSLAKLFKGFIYKRYKVSILNCDSVKPFIVNAESDTSS